MTGPDYNISTFVSTIFKHCTSTGDVCLYVFPHVTEGRARAERQEWVGRHDLSAMNRVIDYARNRPSSVFSPPVALYGTAVNGKGNRTSADHNILEAPAIALELDDTPNESRALAEAVLGTPTLVIRSGGVTATGEDKLHLYWRLIQPARTPDERTRLKAIRGALAQVFNGDTSGVPLGHPMRWPGSWHTKGSPRLCEIIERSESEVDLDQAYDALMLMAPQKSRPDAGSRDGFKTGAPLTGEELTRLLGKIPNGPHVTWEDWNRTGMTVFDASHGSDDGLEAFHNWSSTDSRYDPGDTDTRWYHWFNSPPTDLSSGSLYHAAGEAVPRPDGDTMFGDDGPVELPEGVYTEPPVVTKVKAASKAGFGLRSGDAHRGALHVSSQLDHFEGCVYVTHSDRVLTPEGEELNQSRFDVVKGGYNFVMDEEQSKLTKSAWEAFLKNNCYSPPVVHNTCFRPELEPFEIVQDGTWRLVNTYQPIETPRVKGDPGPFLKHMETLFPDERDRSILMTYMASLVQNPGKKFQWWPVIQGAKGNGKTLLLNILTYCVGEQYSHLPNTSKMTRNGISFNGWLKGKLFLGMDEVYSSQRRDFLEEFKPYVTNRRLPIESKGVDEFTGDNRANGMMLTNHKDGVPVDKDERRYAVFFTKQQSAEDCFKDGLTPDHFQKLWSWLDRDGFAIINDYLRSYVPVPEFDPAVRASRAPRTSSTDHAIEASRGRAEAEIIDAVEEGRMGFKGGYISSRAVAKLMEEKRINLPRNKYKATMDGIDFVPHPSLPEGKTPSVVLPDQARTILYVNRDGPFITTVNTGEIADDYSVKQIGS